MQKTPYLDEAHKIGRQLDSLLAYIIQPKQKPYERLVLLHRAWCLLNELVINLLANQIVRLTYGRNSPTSNVSIYVAVCIKFMCQFDTFPLVVRGRLPFFDLLYLPHFL